MSEGKNAVSQTQRERLAYIELRVFFVGEVRRPDIEARFGIKPAAASRDLTAYKELAPDNLEYDTLAFSAELAAIENNSYNIHKIGSRLVFKIEENARTRLLAHARNDKLFQNGEDTDFLAAEIRHCIGGDVQVSGQYRTIVLKREWNNTPWDEVEEKERPQAWDAKIPLVVLPVHPEKPGPVLGLWLKSFVPQGRNTVRFLLPRRNPADIHHGNVMHDKELLLAARAAFLARQWQSSEPAYKALAGEFSLQIKSKVAERFDRFAVLRLWNHEDPNKCEFSVEPHGTKGERIPMAVQEKIRQNLFVDEDFDEMVVAFAAKNLSMAKLLAELREPRGGGNDCIPWLGEAEAKDSILRVCADGKIAINVRGLKSLQTVPGETEDAALRRMKRDFDATGRQLEDTLLSLPGSSPTSSGQTPAEPAPAGLPGIAPVTPPGTTVPVGSESIFGAPSGGPAIVPTSTRVVSEPTSGLSLLGKMESWRVSGSHFVREKRGRRRESGRTNFLVRGRQALQAQHVRTCGLLGQQPGLWAESDTSLPGPLERIVVEHAGDSRAEG